MGGVLPSCGLVCLYTPKPLLQPHVLSDIYWPGLEKHARNMSVLSGIPHLCPKLCLLLLFSPKLRLRVVIVPFLGNANPKPIPYIPRVSPNASTQKCLALSLKRGNRPFFFRSQSSRIKILKAKHSTNSNNADDHKEHAQHDHSKNCLLLPPCACAAAAAAAAAASTTNSGHWIMKIA